MKMGSKYRELFLGVVILVVASETFVVSLETPCDDWTSFKDEKCFKILDNFFGSYDEAEKNCAKLENSPTLAIVHSKEDQDFLANYLFKTLKKVDNFWIGAKSSNNASFKWVDNTDMNYSNWVKAPKNKTNYCVQMQPEEDVVGKWTDEPCEKRNAAVCQKMQIWSMARLQKSHLEVRKEFRDALEEANKKHKLELDEINNKIIEQKHEFEETNKKNKLELDETNKKIVDQKREFDEANKKNKLELDEANKKVANQKLELDNLKQNLIPIGFLYTQLPNEKPPTSIWPSMNWEDVSSAYAGVFFRVEGGGSEPFGQTQAENDARVIRMETAYDESRTINEGVTIDANRVGQGTDTSGWIWTGDWAKEIHFKLYYRLVTSTGENRPRNMAIRVWKRTG